MLEITYGNSFLPPDGIQTNNNLSSMLRSMKANATLDVRVGYAGMCVRESDVSWICASDSKPMLKQFGPDRDPLNLIWIAHEFRSKAIFPGFMYV